MIGKLIYQFRKQKGMTQDRLVHELMGYPDMFERLNTVTLSHWETGKTRPGMKKSR